MPDQVSDCPLCREIPKSCSMDLELGEGDLPLEAAKQLLGWPSTLCVPLRQELSCPHCGARFWFEIETGGLEWDLYLKRLDPPGGEA